MSDSVIKTYNLGKKFDNIWAVKNLSLEIYQGEIFVLLGPNGAGKTTTLKLLTGLLKPTSGRIEICGYDIQKQPLKVKHYLAYIPDEPYLYDKLTGREFLEFISELYGIPKKEYHNRIEDYIDYFQMVSYIDKLIQGYSHGMRQRLVFSSGFIHEPRIFIIDEPLTGLDPACIRKLKLLLKEKVNQGLTAFISTHTLSFAEEIADRIGIIEEGQLIAIGSQEELRRRSGLEGKLEEIFLKITREEKIETDI